MSKSTISTFELFEMFPDAESARLYFEAKRWPDGPVCPACGETTRIYAKGGGYYRCNADLSVFTVRRRICAWLGWRRPGFRRCLVGPHN